MRNFYFYLNIIFHIKIIKNIYYNKRLLQLLQVYFNIKNKKTGFRTFFFLFAYIFFMYIIHFLLILLGMLIFFPRLLNVFINHDYNIDFKYDNK